MKKKQFVQNKLIKIPTALCPSFKVVVECIMIINKLFESPAAFKHLQHDAPCTVLFNI